MALWCTILLKLSLLLLSFENKFVSKPHEVLKTNYESQIKFANLMTAFHYWS